MKDAKCKLFTTTRIGEVEVLVQSRKHKGEHLAAGLDVFRNSDNKPIGNVVLKVNIRARALLVEEYPLTEKYLAEIDSGHSRFEAPIYNRIGPARFVLGLYANIEVIGDENSGSF